jgi:hypothetical protein
MTISSNISLPRISDGIKSGVNWIRLKLSPNACESVFTNSVLANPELQLIMRDLQKRCKQNLVYNRILTHNDFGFCL